MSPAIDLTCGGDVDSDVDGGDDDDEDGDDEKDENDDKISDGDFEEILKTQLLETFLCWLRPKG